MNFKVRRDGFTLFEVIIAVALVAIMAVAIAAPLMKNLNEGRMARAQSDAQVIGDAVMSFYKDVGEMPLQDDGDAAYDLARMAGNDDFGGGNAGIPRGSNNATDNWRDRGRCGNMTNLMVRNADRNGTVGLYPVSQNPHVRPGWNGPYLERIPLDPWGNPYVVNVYYGRNDVANAERHNMMVISAGPNELFETTFVDNQYNEQLGGDDIGHIIRGSNQQ